MSKHLTSSPYEFVKDVLVPQALQAPDLLVLLESTPGNPAEILNKTSTWLPRLVDGAWKLATLDMKKDGEGALSTWDKPQLVLGGRILNGACLFKIIGSDEKVSFLLLRKIKQKGEQTTNVFATPAGAVDPKDFYDGGDSFTKIKNSCIIGALREFAEETGLFEGEEAFKKDNESMDGFLNRICEKLFAEVPFEINGPIRINLDPETGERIPEEFNRNTHFSPTICVEVRANLDSDLLKSHIHRTTHVESDRDGAAAAVPVLMTSEDLIRYQKECESRGEKFQDRTARIRQYF